MGYSLEIRCRDPTSNVTQKANVDYVGVAATRVTKPIVTNDKSVFRFVTLSSPQGSYLLVNRLLASLYVSAYL